VLDHCGDIVPHFGPMIPKANSMEGSIGVDMTSDWNRMESNENDVVNIDGDDL
jgi:hypothetical protein